MALANRFFSEFKGDRAIWMVMVLLSLFSILIVYSSCGTIAHRQMGGNTEFYLFRQVMVVAGGWLVVYLCYYMSYARFSQIAPYMLVLAAALLMLTLAFGVNINDAKRWLRIPLIGMTIQTSDFAKIALVTYLARAIAIKQENINDFTSAFIPIIAPVAVICGLIAPADLGTAIVLFSTCFIMMFVGRVEVKHLASLVLAGVLVFALLILIGHLVPGSVRTETWVARVTDFLQNDDGSYQTIQGKIAIAKGQLFGLGPGNSLQRNFLPSPYSDYIYAIICEEYGIFGAFFIIGLYVLLFFRVVAMITKAEKKFGSILVIGLCSLICVQALANMAVSVHLIPVTGVTLPMVSMGGTSFWFSSMAFGMILSVSKQVEKENETR